MKVVIRFQQRLCIGQSHVWQKRFGNPYMSVNFTGIMSNLHFLYSTTIVGVAVGCQ